MGRKALNEHVILIGEPGCMVKKEGKSLRVLSVFPVTKYRVEPSTLTSIEMAGTSVLKESSSRLEMSRWL